jgi:Flp pilus assembly protein TadD
MNKLLKGIGFPMVMTAAATLFLAGCAGLGSMEKEIETLGLEATPEPLILRGSTVELQVTGKFPPKYFGKKIVLQATPVLTWEGGSARFTTQGFQGESAAGNFDVVPFKAGKSFTYTAQIPYQPGMEDVATLAIELSGSKGSKTAEFAPYAVGTGVITTPLLVQADDRFILAQHAFVRVKNYTQSATINYELNKSEVRKAELSDADWLQLLGLMQLASKKDSISITGVRIEAFASPEGEITLNEELAVERAASATQAMSREMARLKVPASTELYQQVPKGEDWDGFKTLMQASSIEDKSLILRVLEMYTDKNKREEEIRNISKTYEEIADVILPQLRRSQLVVSYSVTGWSDAELKDLALSAPSRLDVEELLYAATLLEDMNSKLQVYQAAARQFPSDYRGANNAGWCLAQMGRMNQAKEAFNQALAAKREKLVVNNVAALQRQDGDLDGAMKLLNEAAGAGPEVNYNKGIILIQKGDYTSAISNMGRENSVNLALAKLLNGDAAGAKTVLENANDDSAIASYVMAIACARLNDAAGVKRHVDAALAKDGTLRAKAAKDLEFRNFRTQLGL